MKTPRPVCVLCAETCATVSFLLWLWEKIQTFFGTNRIKHCRITEFQLLVWWCIAQSDDWSAICTSDWSAATFQRTLPPQILQKHGAIYQSTSFLRVFAPNVCWMCSGRLTASSGGCCCWCSAASLLFLSSFRTFGRESKYRFRSPEQNMKTWAYIQRQRQW